MSIPQMGPIRQGDVTTVLELDVTEIGGTGNMSDLSSATMTLHRPDGTTFGPKTATFVAGISAVKVQYTLAAGDIDQHGLWPIQARVYNASGGIWGTTEASLKVERLL